MTLNEAISLLMLCGGVCLYFLPALVAGSRKHRQVLAILVLNLFGGWTGFGWIAALVWACTLPAADLS